MVYCCFNSYFTFTAKEKLHFLLICSFYFFAQWMRVEPCKLLSNLPSEVWLLINRLLIKNKFSTTEYLQHICSENFISKLKRKHLQKIESPGLKYFFVNFTIYFRSASFSVFTRMFHCYSLGKRKKTGGFLTFFDGIEMEHWCQIG